MPISQDKNWIDDNGENYQIIGSYVVHNNKKEQQETSTGTFCRRRRHAVL